MEQSITASGARQQQNSQQQTLQGCVHPGHPHQNRSTKQKSLDVVREHHEPSSTWENVRLKKLADEIEPFKNDEGFEQIATALGISRPQKIR